MLAREFEYRIKRFFEEGTTEETLFAGLASEVGEVMQSRVKETRKNMECTAEILDEIGDVLWYICAIAQSRNYSLEEVMKDVIEKLSKRDNQKHFDAHGFYKEVSIPFNLGN